MLATRVKSNGRAPKKMGKRELAEAISYAPDGNDERLMHLDLVGTAEAAEEILKVERARIGKWRRKGILLSTGERISFPDPITVVTTCAVFPPGHSKEGQPDHSKLAASPLWWGDDIRGLAKILSKNKPRD